MRRRTHRPRRPNYDRLPLRLVWLEDRIAPAQFFAVDVGTAQRSIVRSHTGTFEGVHGPLSPALDSLRRVHDALTAEWP